MKRQIRVSVSCHAILLIVFFSMSLGSSVASPAPQNRDKEEFGPVVQAYLGYLRNEQEVVDDRASRREVSASYYRRNSNRIRALRQMALKIAKETHNDYLPELEAVTRDEFGLLFERPPNPQGFRVGEVIKGTFRFLGVVRSSEPFYLFARLDPYEQAELSASQTNVSKVSSQSTDGNAATSTNVPPPRRSLIPK